MRKRTFSGGIHPFEGKSFTEAKSIETLPNPKTVYIPLQQHIGAPTTVLVAKGDEVKAGQKIGEVNGFVSAPVHSSVSGVVKAVQEYNHPVSGKGMAVVIEVAEEQVWDESIKFEEDYFSLSAEEMKNRIKEAGLAGLGGATFPTHVKLSPPADKKIDVVLLNGAECEPFLTADHRLMLEEPKAIVEGLKIFMKVLDLNRGMIGIEDNKPDAIKSMQEAIRGEAGLEVVVCPVKYPQGAEKQLIKAALDRDVPAGGLPMDVGVVVQNVGTAKAAYDAVSRKAPLTHRIVTVTGAGINTPKNILAPVGALFQDLVDFCDGLNDKAGKIIMGGPMMGMTQPDLNRPIIKGASGILVLDEKKSHLPPEDPCINCGRCVEICPMKLLPTTLQVLVENERYIDAEHLNVMDCIECGSCSYICPANRYLLQGIRLGKKKVLENRRKAS